MVTRLVDLGCLELKSQARSNLYLVTSSSLMIEAATVLDEATPEEISRRSKDGTVWIAKAGSCRLDFSWLFRDCSEQRLEEPRPMMMKLIAQCPVGSGLLASVFSCSALT